MRIKLALSSIVLALLAGAYVFFSLPPVLESAFYVSYLAEYHGFISRGLSVLLIVVGAYIASLVLHLVITRAFPSALRSNALAKKLLPLIQNTASLFIWLVAAVFILSTLGINISALVTGAGVGGIMFALASKEAASNLFGSLSLIFSKNFKIGDAIKVKGYEGTVDEISLSYTRLVDRKGTVIFMPNKLIVSETIENLSMSGVKRAEFAFDIPSSLSTKETEKFIWDLTKSIAKLEKSHGTLSPRISIEGLTGESQSLSVRIESNEGDMHAIRQEVWMTIKDRVDTIKTA